MTADVSMLNISGTLQPIETVAVSDLAGLNVTSRYDGDPYDCDTYSPNKSYQRVLAGCGAFAAAVVIVQNAITIVALLHDKRCFRSYFVILLLMVFFDFIACIAYIPLVIMEQLSDLISHTWFYRRSRDFGAELIMFTQVALIASCYLIVVLQIERYCLTVSKYKKFVNPKVRTVAVTSALLLAILMKAPVYFEAEVVMIRDPMTNVSITRLLPLQVNSDWYRFYQTWLRHAMCTFLPFLLLIAINCQIVNKLRKANRRARLFRIMDTDGHKHKVRSATRGFLLITFTYLASNAIQVLLTVWEHVDMDSLINRFCRFYIATSDLVSLLTITGCALRVPICLACNKDLRHSAQLLLARFMVSTYEKYDNVRRQSTFILTKHSVMRPSDVSHLKAQASNASSNQPQRPSELSALLTNGTCMLGRTDGDCSPMAARLPNKVSVDQRPSLCTRYKQRHSMAADVGSLLPATTIRRGTGTGALGSGGGGGRLSKPSSKPGSLLDQITIQIALSSSTVNVHRPSHGGGDHHNNRRLPRSGLEVSISDCGAGADHCASSPALNRQYQPGQLQRPTHLLYHSNGTVVVSNNNSSSQLSRTPECDECDIATGKYCDKNDNHYANGNRHLIIYDSEDDTLL